MSGTSEDAGCLSGWNWWPTAIPRNRSIRAAIFVALTLSFSWAALPARGEPGTIYRYTSSLPDGSRAGDELLFVSGSRAEVLVKVKSEDKAGLLVAVDLTKEMLERARRDHPGGHAETAEGSP